jgi:GxxExxY protein
VTVDPGFTQSTKAPKALALDALNVPLVESLPAAVVDCGFAVHDDLGPGLLESAYETFLAAALRERNLRVEQQRPVAVTYKGVAVKEAFRADLIIEDAQIVEIKSIEKLTAVHPKQVLTYLRLTGLPLSLLINFGEAMFRNGVKRVINNRSPYRAPTP